MIQAKRQKRLKVLSNILNTEEKLSNNALQVKLEEKGHKVSIQQILADKRELSSRPNTFVADLAKANYSRFIEERIRRMLKCSDVLEEILDNSEKPNDKIRAAKVLHEMENNLTKLVSTDILKISASNWAIYVKELEQTIQELRTQIKH